MRIFGIQADRRSVEFAREPFHAGHGEKTLQDWVASKQDGTNTGNEPLIFRR